MRMTALVTPAAIGAVSYGLAGLAYALLAAWVLLRRPARQPGLALGLAAALSAAWASVTAWCSWSGAAAPQLAQLAELLRTVGWLLLLMQILLRSGMRLARLFLFGAAAAGLQLVAGGMALASPGAPRHWLLLGALVVLASRVLLAVQGMLLVEQLARRAAPDQRWGIKFACLGLGVLFGYDFYLYSDALLMQHIDADLWAARGIVDALCAPLLLLSAVRAGSWAPQLVLSRQLLFRSVALLGSSLYLLAMAGCAYYLRYVGGAWGAVMQFASLGAAAILLLCLLFSGAMRARLKVALAKHFYRTRFDYRHEWLRFTRALADAGPDVSQRTIQAVAELVESPAGALWLRGERGLWQPAASWNMAHQAPLAPADAGFCQFLAARQWVVDVPASLAAPQHYPGLLLPPWLVALPQAWLVVPLMLHGGLFGFVLLLAPRARLALNWEVTDLLKIAGSQAASYLAQRQLADSLAVARQFESFNRMSTFIVHDLKNLVFQLSLVVSNGARHKANPAFQDDMLATLEHSVQKMTSLLHRLNRSDDGAPAEAAGPVPLEALLARLVGRRAATASAAAPLPQLALPPSGGPLLQVQADAGRLERVLGHLLQNALEATGPGGHVLVRLSHSGAVAVIELVDSGHGMSQQFIRERLFKPFESTKVAGMGIGVFESREYLHEIGGQLGVDSAPERGTTFRVTLPLFQPAPARPGTAPRHDTALGNRPAPA